MAAMMNMNNLLNGKDSRWLQLEVCREFQRNKCSRQDTECKFAHPPANVEVQNGKVTACYDSIKGRCNREKPPCKYFHPPQHLKDQLLINGRNHLALKNALMQQMGIAPGQPVIPGQVPAVATNPYLTGIPASTYSPYFAPGHLVPALLGPDPSTVASQLGPVVPQAVPVAQQKIPRSDRLEVCREFMRGACKRAESECRFAHPQESVTTHEDGSVTVCMDAVKGRCARDPCRYFHPPLHLQAQIKAAQSRATANAPVSAVAAATLTHPIPTPGAATTTAVTIGHPLEIGKKRAAENDMFQLMDVKTVGSFYYENFAFSGMVPYKRPAAEKSGIPVYQPGATTYQQLMQLQQPFVPVSCEYPSPSPSATTAIPQPQSSTTANPIIANNKNNNQINLNNNSNSNGVVVSNSNLSNNLSSINSNSTASSSNGIVVSSASIQTPSTHNTLTNNNSLNSINNNNNSSSNTNSNHLALQVTANSVATSTVSSADQVNKAKQDGINSLAGATVSQQQPLTPQSQAHAYQQIHHQVQAQQQHNNQVLQNQHNMLHTQTSQAPVSASALTYPSNASSAITIPHNSPANYTYAAMSYYQDAATIAKEVAQKNYANALKMAAASNQLSGKPLTALSYTGVALNKMVVNPAAVAAAAAANQAAVASRMSTSIPGTVQTVSYSAAPNLMSRPPNSYAQSGHHFVRPQMSLAAATATNPYAAAAAAAANQQFLNHSQNIFYPGFVGYPFGVGAASPAIATGHAVPTAMPANLAGTIPAVPTVASVAPGSATPGSAVVLNPYKKMKTS